LTWVSQYQNVSILDVIGAKGDGGGGDNWSYKTCMCVCSKVNLREMQLRQKQERRQIEQYDRQSQARRDALATAFERDKQVYCSC